MKSSPSQQHHPKESKESLSLRSVEASNSKNVCDTKVLDAIFQQNKRLQKQDETIWSMYYLANQFSSKYISNQYQRLDQNDIAAIREKQIRYIFDKIKDLEGNIAINLGRNDIVDKDIEYLASILKQASKIRELKLILHRNRITDKGLGELISALQDNKNIILTELDIKGNNLTGKGIDILLQYIESDTNLLTLNLEDNKLPFPKLVELIDGLNKSNTSLNELNIANNDFSYKDLKKLFENRDLLNNTKIKELNLINDSIAKDDRYIGELREDAALLENKELKIHFRAAEKHSEKYKLTRKADRSDLLELEVFIKSNEKRKLFSYKYDFSAINIAPHQLASLQEMITGSRSAPTQKGQIAIDKVPEPLRTKISSNLKLNNVNFYPIEIGYDLTGKKSKPNKSDDLGNVEIKFFDCQQLKLISLNIHIEPGSSNNNILNSIINEYQKFLSFTQTRDFHSVVSTLNEENYTTFGFRKNNNYYKGFDRNIPRPIQTDVPSNELHKAVTENNLEFIKKLSEDPVLFASMLQARDSEGLTPIHLAICLNHANIVDWFIDEFDKFEQPKATLLDKNGNNLAHLAACIGYDHILKKLLEKGFDVILPNQEGNTILHLAAKYNHINIVKSLIEKYEALNELSKFINHDSRTAYDVAFKSLSIDVVTYFQEKYPHSQLYRTVVEAFNGTENTNLMRCMTQQGVRIDWNPANICNDLFLARVAKLLTNNIDTTKANDGSIKPSKQEKDQVTHYQSSWRSNTRERYADSTFSSRARDNNARTSSSSYEDWSYRERNNSRWSQGRDARGHDPQTSNSSAENWRSKTGNKTGSFQKDNRANFK